MRALTLLSVLFFNDPTETLNELDEILVIAAEDPHMDLATEVMIQSKRMEIEKKIHDLFTPEPMRCFL